MVLAGMEKYKGLWLCLLPAPMITIGFTFSKKKDVNFFVVVFTEKDTDAKRSIN